MDPYTFCGQTKLAKTSTMGKIYGIPEEIKTPECFSENWKKDEELFIAELRKFLTDNGHTGTNAGTIVSFPYADGQARYMIISMKPMQMFHLPLGDAWDYPYVDRLTAKDIQERLNFTQQFHKSLHTD